MLSVNLAIQNSMGDKGKEELQWILTSFQNCPTNQYENDTIHIMSVHTERPMKNLTELHKNITIFECSFHKIRF